ncbi:hypothetical protein, partial [Pseudomonas aeruginosa]|uniref:hypothetical protein n=1 Tax=Pseudomonas aeruginosa TaxID=287 RepID=UPI002B4094CC
PAAGTSPSGAATTEKTADEDKDLVLTSAKKRKSGAAGEIVVGVDGSESGADSGAAVTVGTGPVATAMDVPIRLSPSDVQYIQRLS